MFINDVELNVYPNDIGREWEFQFKVGNKIAQAFMDELWEAWVRPKNFDFKRWLDKILEVRS